MSFVLKLPSHDLPGAHRLGGGTPREGLKVGLLIHANHHIAPLAQPPHSFITPQDLRCSRGELSVDGGCLPVATAVRLQTGSSEYARNRRVVNRVHDGLLDDHLLKSATVPAGQVQSTGRWINTGD